MPHRSGDTDFGRARLCQPNLNNRSPKNFIKGDQPCWGGELALHVTIYQHCLVSILFHTSSDSFQPVKLPFITAADRWQLATSQKGFVEHDWLKRLLSPCSLMRLPGFCNLAHFRYSADDLWFLLRWFTLRCGEMRLLLNFQAFVVVFNKHRLVFGLAFFVPFGSYFLFGQFYNALIGTYV